MVIYVDGLFFVKPPEIAKKYFSDHTFWIFFINFNFLNYYINIKLSSNDIINLDVILSKLYKFS